MGKLTRLCALLAAVTLLASGCVLRRQEPETPGEISLPEPTREAPNMILGERLPARNTGVTLYYALADGASFSTVTRSIRTEAGESLLEAAVNALLSPSPSGEEMYFSTGDTRLLSCGFACGIATVNLSIDARNVQSEQELLSLVTAIGNTLLGIEGVRGVNVLIGGQSESFCQLPLGVQTAVVTSVTASYAQLQAERDHFLIEGSMPIARTAALYFPTESGTWLVPELRELTFDSEDLAGALVEALKAGPADRTCAITAIPEGVELLDARPRIQTLSSGEHVISLNFSSTLANYLAFSGLEVWELAGSVALTMCGFLPQLDAVRVLVNGEPITICEIGDVLVSFPDGLIRLGDFSSRVGSVATLYLVDESGALQPVKRAVSQHSALSPRSLMTELFEYAGDGAGPRFPVPDSLSAGDLLGIQVSGNVARVNLSASFYRSCQSLEPQTERNLVYAIVNTLCQLRDIRAVRFYVEGLSADTLAGGIYLKSALMPNPGLVAAPEPPATAAP